MTIIVIMCTGIFNSYRHYCFCGYHCTM